ncbi:MAG TPA: pitrilysin family protein [Bacillota bacterium]|nr:pitrilysin family protein [Bacillota bacterium]
MIKTYTLDNGMRIVLEKVPTVRSVTMGIWVLAGSRNETSINNGISHFVEHMLFKGTKSRSAQDIAEAFDSIGGQVNAFTSKEYTCYYAKVIDSHKESALRILSDMFFHSVFSEEEIDREKQVILEEISMSEDTPDDIIHDVLAEASFDKHPLAFPILGNEERLNSFTRDDFLHYMGEHYTPQNVVVSIAGNVDESFIKEIEKHFSFENHEQTTEQLSIEKPLFVPKQKEIIKDTEQAHMCIGLNGLSIHDELTYSLAVLNNAFGGSMSSRLFQEIREKRGLAYSVYSFHSAYKDSGLLTVYAGTNKRNLRVVKETIQEIVEKIISDGLTAKELTNSKEQLKGSLMLGLESTDSRMNRNGHNELLNLPHKTLDEVIEKIERVNHESIDEVVKRVLASDQSLATIIPEG